MKKQIIAISVIMLFASLTFIPCIKGNSDVYIIESRNVKSNTRLKELSKNLMKLKTILIDNSKDDCGCDDITPRWRFPILCLLITPLWIIIAIITEIITPIMNPPFLYFAIASIGTKLGCWWG